VRGSALVAAAALLLAACEAPRRQEHELDRYFDALADPTGENVLVSIEQFDVDEVDRFLLETAWLYTSDGGEAAAIPPACRANGIRFGVGTPGLAVELRAARSRAASCSHQKLDLRVLNGRTGMIHVSEETSVPVTLATWNGRLEQRVLAFSRARGGFEVRPERVGSDRVRLDLTPVILTSEGAGGETLTELRASVTVPRGTPVAIGAHEMDNRSFGSTFFSTRSERERRRRLILVSAR
jgi:hypothetical protein